MIYLLSALPRAQQGLGTTKTNRSITPIYQGSSCLTSLRDDFQPTPTTAVTQKSWAPWPSKIIEMPHLSVPTIAVVINDQ